MSELHAPIAAIVRYVNYGVRPGSFTAAVLANDLVGAVSSAHPMIRPYLRGLVFFVVNEVPHAAWGSEEKVALWLAGGGLEKISSKPLVAETDAQLTEWAQYYESA